MGRNKGCSKAGVKCSGNETVRALAASENHPRIKAFSTAACQGLASVDKMAAAGSIAEGRACPAGNGGELHVGHTFTLSPHASSHEPGWLLSLGTLGLAADCMHERWNRLTSEISDWGLGRRLSRFSTCCASMRT